MQKKYFTFLYVPSENTGLKTLRVPRWMVYALLGTLVALVASTTIAVLKYASKIGDTYRVAVLENENAVLKAELDAFTREMSQLDRQVQQNFDFQKKARLLADMTEINEDVTEVGIGGPSTGYIEAISLLDLKSQKKVASLKEDLDKLMRQARLQTQSYKDIIDTLTVNKAMLNATPSIRPVPSGFISSGYGRRMDPFTGRSAWHRGLDYSVRLGTSIFATADGVVTHAGKWGQYGLTVEISHGFGYVTRYAHTSKVLVRKGQKVKRGDVIAKVGASGRATTTHLHYEVIHNGTRKNPLSFILSGNEIAN